VPANRHLPAFRLLIGKLVLLVLLLCSRALQLQRAWRGLLADVLQLQRQLLLLQRQRQCPLLQQAHGLLADVLQSQRQLQRQLLRQLVLLVLRRWQHS
jgi:hypothetical protein